MQLCLYCHTLFVYTVVKKYNVTILKKGVTSHEKNHIT